MTDVKSEVLDREAQLSVLEDLIWQIEQDVVPDFKERIRKAATFDAGTARLHYAEGLAVHAAEYLKDYLAILKAQS